MVEKLKKLRVLSLGAGVQSSTLAFMYDLGEIGPMPDFAVFADTMAEPKEVYDWFDWMKGKIKNYPIHVISAGDIEQDSIEAAEGLHTSRTPPFFTKDPNKNSMGILTRQCTGHYKIEPIHKFIREHMGYKKGQRVKKGTVVEMIMGISRDETYRVKEARKPWIKNVYPLVDRNITRAMCKKWFEDHEMPKPPRSACTFCPYKTWKEWKYLKDNSPEEFQHVIEFEKKINGGFKGMREGYTVFVTKEGKPLSEIDIDEKAKDNGQMSMFDELGGVTVNDCEGMCGV